MMAAFCLPDVERCTSFGVTVADLQAITADADVKKFLEKYESVDEVVRRLQTSAETGLSAVEEEDGYRHRIARFGRNVLPEPNRRTFFQLFMETFDDFMLRVLLALSIISLVLGSVFHADDNGWIEGFAILLTVLIVSLIGAVNNWNQDRQFRILNRAKDAIFVKVVRNGQTRSIPIADLVTGDLVRLECGNQVPADGLCVSSYGLCVDESVMTGESDSIRKSKDKMPFMLSGCQVCGGEGSMVVTSVGMHSEWGRVIAALVTEPEPTPLQEKLDKLANDMGKIGTTFAVIIFITLTTFWAVSKAQRKDFTASDLIDLIDFAVIAITIIVVGFPEGLPLTVTVSLAYSVMKMMEDKNLVRNLASCETMGNATQICSDKTGTLTENRMTVTEGFFAGKVFKSTPTSADLDSKFVELNNAAIAMNSSADFHFSDDDGKNDTTKPVFAGNQTECALLYMMHCQFSTDYTRIRSQMELGKLKLMCWPFSSDHKRMSTLIALKNNNSSDVVVGYRLFTKGASEIVSRLCTKLWDADNTVNDISDQTRTLIEDYITSMASNGLRTFAIAYRDFPADANLEHLTAYDAAPESELTLLSLVGMKDPLRKGVSEAIAQCKRSGITVRMITGDNIMTARCIANECGILETDSDVCIEGPEFRRMTNEQIDAILPHLKVMARSTPSDKYRLVKRLKKKGEVVAVTGDGTNDGPALKKADVGLAMNSGSEVAKAASDIVVIDDNFASIVRSVLWGRSIFDNVRKFLQFQLTVNSVALVVVIVTALSGDEPPLKAVQLLWMNVVMDSFGALALATEPPLQSLLDRLPCGRFDPLISSTMIRNSFGQSLLQLCICFTLFYKGEKLFHLDSSAESAKVIGTIVFNTFVWCQLFNVLNCRKLTDELNIFHNMLASKMFIFLWFCSAGFQVLIIQYGYKATRTTPLNADQWTACIVIALLTIPWACVLKQIPVKPRVAQPPSKEELAAIKEEARVRSGKKKKKTAAATSDVVPSVITVPSSIC